MDSQNVASEEGQLKKLNRWLFLLIIFIVIWTLGMVVYVQKKLETSQVVESPLIVMDSVSGKVTNSTHVNLFPVPLSSGRALSPAFEQRESYKALDFVIINYFFVPGLVVEKKGESYIVMYKSEDGTLQFITVPRDLLVSPAPGTVMNPASLMSR